MPFLKTYYFYLSESEIQVSLDQEVLLLFQEIIMMNVHIYDVCFVALDEAKYTTYPAICAGPGWKRFQAIRKQCFSARVERKDWSSDMVWSVIRLEGWAYTCSKQLTLTMFSPGPTYTFVSVFRQTVLLHAPMSLHKLIILIGMPFPFVLTNELLVIFEDPDEITYFGRFPSLSWVIR